MRDVFHEELDRITEQLVEMTRLAGSAMSRATTALLDADVHLAESVIEADQRIDAVRDQLERLSIDILARQQPVATDLRTVVTALRMSADLERMGDLSRHVAKVARLRYPQSAVPPQLRSHFTQMGAVAAGIVSKAGTIIAAKDVDAARTLEDDDDAMDALHRELFSQAINENFAFTRETVVDIALLGRYYERFADHAVSIARRVVYLVTGEFEGDEDGEPEHGLAQEAGVAD